MDVKSAFLYGTIEEEVYVCQPPGFKDPDYLNKVYKVVKALYGVHQAPRAWYETFAKYLLDNGFHRGKIDQTLFIKKQKGDILLVQVYVDDIIFGSTKKELCTEFEKLMHDKFQMSSMAEILRKFSFTDVRKASTPMDTDKPLLKDSDGDDVDVYLYRSMIRSLMYLTSSRPDIMFPICACARFQVSPKASHLHSMERIFRYLKGQPKLGLWYPRDSSFNLVAYSDSDYAGASLDRKSTIGGCQFLGCRLISWQCKKQTVVATSSTEAKYVAAASCCGQLITHPRQIKRGRDTKIPQSSGPPEKVGDEVVHKELGDRMERAATIAYSLEVEQDSGAKIPYWGQTASASTLENGDMEITATIDGKVKVVSKASIRRHLKLKDSDGISTFPTTEIFEQLALSAKETASISPKNLYCSFPYPKLFSNMKRVSKGYTGETEVPQLSSPTQTHVADDVAFTGMDDRHGGAATTVSGLEAGQGSGNIHKTPTMPHDLPLLIVHTLESDEGRMQPNELMELVTKLSDRVAVLENDLKQTKKTYGAAFTKLIKKVKTLEKTIKSSKARKRAKFVVSDDEEEDCFNQGGKLLNLMMTLIFSLVQQMIHHDAQTQERQEYDLEPNFEFTAPEEVYTAEPDISTTNVPVSTTGAKVSTAAESLVYIRRSAATRKYKGKAIVEESEPTKTKSKLHARKEVGLKEAQSLQEQFDKERGKGFEEGVNTFTPMESDDTVPKVVAGSSKRSAKEELGEEISKRQKIGEGSEPTKESKDKESDELSQE
ncbi:putative ribonuclease H-like domain-containing protein [Tanacetum coccineum]